MNNKNTTVEVIDESMVLNYDHVESAAKVMEHFWRRMAMKFPERSTKYNELRLEAQNVWKALAST
jgi:hypothetical protein